MKPCLRTIPNSVALTSPKPGPFWDGIRRLIWKPDCACRWITSARPWADTFRTVIILSGVEGPHKLIIAWPCRGASTCSHWACAARVGARDDSYFQVLRQTVLSRLRSNQLFYLLPLLGGVEAELHSHPEAGMNHLHRSPNPQFHVVGANHDIQYRVRRKRRLSLYVTAART